MEKIILLCCLAFLISCNENQQQETSPSDAAGLSDTLEVETNRRVTLLPEAEERIADWLAYATAYNQVEDMRSATGRELVANSQPMVQIMQSLSTTLPDSLQQTAVRARTTVLLTKANLLSQVSNKKDISPKEVFKAANDIILEFDNFKIQLNELFLQTPKDFDIELDRQFEENLDSVKEIRKIPMPVREVLNKKEI